MRGFLHNHLQTTHNYSKEEANAKAAIIDSKALKEEVLGQNFNGSIHLVVLDLETTGLVDENQPLPHIVELAVQNFDGGQYSSLVNPEIHIPEAATKIHNITDEMVASAPSIEAVGRQLVTWGNSFSCPQDIVMFVAHNGEYFDKPILLHWLEDTKIQLLNNWRFGETLPLFKKHLKMGERKHGAYKLESIYKHFFGESIDKHHRVEGDVEALYKCLLQLFGACTKTSIADNIVQALLES